MRLIGLINGWTEAPECWRHFFVPPVRVRRESVLILDAVHGGGFLNRRFALSVQVLGVVLFLEINRGLRA